MRQKKSEHDRLVAEAEKAIDNLFSDTTVSAGKTISDLRDLMDFIHMKLKSLGG